MGLFRYAIDEGRERKQNSYLGEREREGNEELGFDFDFGFCSFSNF